MVDILTKLNSGKSAVQKYNRKNIITKYFYSGAKWENQAETVYNALRLNFILNAENTKTLLKVMQAIFILEKNTSKCLEDILGVERSSNEKYETTIEKLEKFKTDIEADKKKNMENLSKFLSEKLRENKEVDEEVFTLFEGMFEKANSLDNLLIKQTEKIIDVENYFSNEIKFLTEKMEADKQENDEKIEEVRDDFELKIKALKEELLEEILVEKEKNDRLEIEMKKNKKLFIISNITILILLVILFGKIYF